MEKLTAAAFDQLRKEAEQGNVRAQFELAGAYYNGNGVARHPFEGARWLLRAAEQGYAPAQCDLGAMYVRGVGVEQSYQEALKWLRKAAEQGDALAQHSLGSIYAKGFRDKSVGFFYRVVLANATRDYVEAYKWFTLAAKNGHPQSLKDRALIAKLWMKDYQISRAEELVREFERAISAAAASDSLPQHVPRSRWDRFADFDKRPLTRALLLRVDAVKADNEKWLNSLGREPLKVETTPAEEIQTAVVIDALRVTEDAQAAISLKWKPFLPGDPRPPHTNSVVTFGFFVTLHILGHVRKEGHSHPDDGTLFPRVVDGLFVMGTDAEKADIFRSAFQTYDQILRSNVPNVREWRESLLNLVFLYLKDDEKIKQRGFPAFFGSLLNSLISAEG